MSSLQVLLYSWPVGGGGLRLPSSHLCPLNLQAPQSNPPSLTPRGYSSNSCFEVLYIVQNVRRCYTPSWGSWKVGFCWTCVPVRHPLPKQTQQQVGGWVGGISLSLSSFLTLLPPRSTTKLGERALCWGLGAGGVGHARTYTDPALSRALAAGTVLQWVIGKLEYCFCCLGKAGTPTRVHPPGKS